MTFKISPLGICFTFFGSQNFLFVLSLLFSLIILAKSSCPFYQSF